MIKNAVISHTHETDSYLIIDDIENTENEFGTLALQTLIKELVKSPVKQNYVSQAVFVALRARTREWTYKCGFAVSYDEYVKFSCHWVLMKCIMDVMFLVNLKEAAILGGN